MITIARARLVLTLQTGACTQLSISTGHPPLSADHRPSTPRLGDSLSRGTGTSCAAGSGGKSPGAHGRGSRGRAAWVGCGRLCTRVPGKASEAAVLGLRKAAGSLLSAEAGHGTSPPAEPRCVLAVTQRPCGAQRRVRSVPCVSADIWLNNVM